MRNGAYAHQCGVSPEYRCSNEPPLPADCEVSSEDYVWCFIRTYVPLVHDTASAVARIGVFDDASDTWKFIDEIPSLAARPAGVTHVVKFLPIRMKQVPFKTDDTVILIWMTWAIKAPLFFYATLRKQGTLDERLELHTTNARDAL